MAELVDAQRSGRCVRKDVGVQLSLPAPDNLMNNLIDLMLPISGNRQAGQPRQPGQSTQAGLAKKKTGSGFQKVPPPPPPPPPIMSGRVFDGRAVIVILIIIMGVFAVLIAIGS